MTSSVRYDHSIDAILNGADHHSNGDSHPRRRRSRTVFSTEAITRMEKEFELNKYPDIRQRETIAADIGVSEARVQVWFQNKRARYNKRRQSDDRVPEVGNACKRQRLDPPIQHNHGNKSCKEAKFDTRQEVSEGASQIPLGAHALQFPGYPYMYQHYHAFLLSSLQTTSHLHIALGMKHKPLDDGADDIVKRLFRFSSSDGRPSAQGEADLQQQVYRMIVPTKKTTDCSVTELRASDSTRFGR